MRAASVFHWVPDAMTGSVLYPLNELKERAPGVWRRERAKYDGREEVLELRIPLLDCVWNDVLHFSTVHPAKIVAALEAVGLQPLRRRFFELDAADLDPGRSIIFLNRRKRIEDPIADESQWIPFDPDEVPRLSRLTEPTRRYYRECASRGTRPLLYGYLPHVLFRGSVDTRTQKLIEL